jgi:hypothetical protein
MPGWACSSSGSSLGGGTGMRPPDRVGKGARPAPDHAGALCVCNARRARGRGRHAHDEDEEDEELLRDEENEGSIVHRLTVRGRRRSTSSPTGWHVQPGALSSCVPSRARQLAAPPAGP